MNFFFGVLLLLYKIWAPFALIGLNYLCLRFNFFNLSPWLLIGSVLLEDLVIFFPIEGGGDFFSGNIYPWYAPALVAIPNQQFSLAAGLVMIGLSVASILVFTVWLKINPF